MNAIAAKDDLTRINRQQFGILFKVADRGRTGRVNWDDFFLFETLLKRPDAEYLIAFEYFDVYACIQCHFRDILIFNYLVMGLGPFPRTSS